MCCLGGMLQVSYIPPWACAPVYFTLWKYKQSSRVMQNHLPMPNLELWTTPVLLCLSTRLLFALISLGKFDTAQRKQNLWVIHNSARVLDDAGSLISIHHVQYSGCHSYHKCPESWAPNPPTDFSRKHTSLALYAAEERPVNNRTLFTISKVSLHPQFQAYVRPNH